MLKKKEIIEISMSSYFQIPRWIKDLRRTMSKASIDLQDHLFYLFSNDWSNGYDVFFIARLAKELDYSENTIRKALNECINKKIFLVHDMGIDGKLILKNNDSNQQLLNDILSSKKHVSVNLKTTLKISNDNVITPFKKDVITPHQFEGLPSTTVRGYPQLQLGVTLNCSEGLDSTQSVDMIDSQHTPRKYIENIKENSKRKDHKYIENIDKNNVENIYPTYLNKSEEEQIKKALDDLLDGRLEITPSNIDSLKKKVSEFRKIRPVSETIKLIKTLPDFVKASKSKNPDKIYEDKQSLTYLVKILENSEGNYPKWFLDSQKQEVIQKQVNDLEDSWKQTTSIWKAQGRRIDDSIKIMISTILNFIQDSEYHKQNNLEYTNIRYLEFFNESIIKTLKKKSVDEMIEIIKDYTSRQFNSLEPFKKVSDSFFNAGLDFETIKLYFENVKG